MEPQDLETKSVRSEALQAIPKKWDPLQKGTQAVEIPRRRDRRARTYVAQERELAAGTPGATCQ